MTQAFQKKKSNFEASVRNICNLNTKYICTLP